MVFDLLLSPSFIVAIREFSWLYPVKPVRRRWEDVVVALIKAKARAQPWWRLPPSQRSSSSSGGGGEGSSPIEESNKAVAAAVADLGKIYVIGKNHPTNRCWLVTIIIRGEARGERN